MSFSRYAVRRYSKTRKTRQQLTRSLVLGNSDCIKLEPCPSQGYKKDMGVLPEQRMASLFSSVGLHGGNTSAGAQDRASTSESDKPEIRKSKEIF